MERVAACHAAGDQGGVQVFRGLIDFIVVGGDGNVEDGGILGRAPVAIFIDVFGVGGLVIDFDHAIVKTQGLGRERGRQQHYNNSERRGSWAQISPEV